MAVFGPEEHKKNIHHHLDRMLEVFAHISMGDFSKRIDISGLPPDDDFTTVLRGLDMMLDDLAEAQGELKRVKSQLEEQVSERTSQLASANERLNHEIEERKKIEQVLREGLQQYRLLAESASDFIYIFDRDMRITYANKASLEFLKVTKQELFGKHVRNFVPFSRIGLDNVNLFEAVESGVPLMYQNQVVFHQGALWLDTVLVPIRGPDNRITSLMGISRDITEQRKAGEVLVEREKFLSDVFASIQDGISVLDSDLRIVRVNAKMEEWYPHALPMAGKKCYEVYHGRSEPCRACPSTVAIRTKKAACEVVPMHGKDGAVRGWQDLYAFPVFDKATGEVKGVIEHVRDISERRVAEEKVRQSEAKFRTLAETAGAGIFIVKNFKFCYVNSLMEKELGYAKEELYTMDFWEIVHPDFRTIVQERYKARMRGEPVTGEYEFKYVKKNGEAGWVTHNVGLIEFDGGPAVIGTLFETTERKKMEEALAAEKELLSVTMQSIGDGVVSVDAAGTILTINRYAVGLACGHADDPVGKPLDEVICFVDDPAAAPRPGHGAGIPAPRSGLQDERRVSVRTGRGDVRLVDLSVSPIAAAAGVAAGMVFVFRDVTEKQKLETELYKARKLESLGVLAGGIAHDFNNILTGVITNLFMAKVKAKGDADGYQLLAEAEKACFKASKLVKQLLTFSKGGAPVKEAVFLKEMIEDAIGFCLSGSNVNYKLQVADNLPPVEADKGQIDQVLNNLIINADQAMPHGGTVVVTAETATVDSGKTPPEALVPGLHDGNYVKVSVFDEGVGIPRENLEKIFDPYFTTKPGGNGLGLTIVYSIVKSHRGAVTVDSQTGRGTVISFYLPVAKTPVKQEAEPGSAPLAVRPLKVLVMDDDGAVRTVISQLLKNSGYSVSCTASGEDTIRSYGAARDAGTPFDIVVMDLTIPGGMGGKDAVKELLAMDPNARVVVSSGYSSDPIMANFRDYGFCGAIAKPFNIDEFLGVIRNASELDRQDDTTVT